MESSLSSVAQNIDRQTRLDRAEALVDASPIAMFTCRAGGDFGITFVSEGIRTLWGYEPEDFLRQPGFWIHNGNFGLMRFFSRLVAIQIKARQVGLPTPVHGLG